MCFGCKERFVIVTKFKIKKFIFKTMCMCAGMLMWVRMFTEARRGCWTLEWEL